MSWNYRVGCKQHAFGHLEYGIVEAYYENAKVVGVTGFVSPYSDELKGFKWSLQKMLEACDKEVLNLDDIEGEG